MGQSRQYNINDSFSVKDFAKDVGEFIKNKYKLETQIFHQNNQCVIQGREFKKSILKIAGMSKAITIKIDYSDSSMYIDIGEGKWVDKAIGGAAGAILFLPLLIPATIGAYKQLQMPKEIFWFIDKRLMTEIIESEDSVENAASEEFQDEEIFVEKKLHNYVIKGKKSKKFVSRKLQENGQNCTSTVQEESVDIEEKTLTESIFDANMEDEEATFSTEKKTGFKSGIKNEKLIIVIVSATVIVIIFFASFDRLNNNSINSSKNNVAAESAVNIIVTEDAIENVSEDAIAIVSEGAFVAEVEPVEEKPVTVGLDPVVPAEPIVPQSVIDAENEKKARQDYISEATTISYDKLIRNPDEYVGKHLKVRVKITQELIGKTIDTPIVSFGFESGYQGYDGNNVWYLNYKLPEGESRIIEGDKVTFYGEFVGLAKMTISVTKEKVYVPKLEVKYHVIN